MAFIGRYPEKTKVLAREMSAQGKTVYEIAAHIGCGDVVVRRWLDEAYRQRYNQRARDKARAMRGEVVA